MIIKNKIIPFGNYLAINLFGFIFTKKPLNKYQINHELIHTAQMKELLYIGFYIIYILEFVEKLVWYGNWNKAYRNISFEKEAFRHERNLKYLKSRKIFNQWRVQ